MRRHKRTRKISITDVCSSCGKPITFEADEVPLKYGRDEKDSPTILTYPVKCPYCGFQNRFQVKQND